MRILFFAGLLALLGGCVTLDDDQADRAAQVQKSEQVHLALASLEQISDELWFAGYESVEELDVAAESAHRYILLDFRFYRRPDVELMQASVATICGAIYGNPPLVSDIHSLGYEEVAVAFDDGRPIDCLKRTP